MKSRCFTLILFLSLFVLQNAWAQLEQEEESSSQNYTRNLPGSVSSSGALKLDEPISYKGVLPCADCPGINTWLNLFPGGWYTLSMDYLERSSEPYYELGRWTSSSNGTTLQLNDGNGNSSWRLLQGGKLRLLDSDGGDIESGLGYDLQREMVFDWFTPRLNLHGTYRYYADAATFTECVSGQRWPVAMVGANQSVERAYSQSGVSQNQGLLVEIEARLAMLPEVDGNGYAPSIVPLRYIRSWPGDSCEDIAGGIGGGNDDDDDDYDDDDNSPYPLEGTRWGLVRLGGNSLRAADDNQPYMTLSSSDDRVTGNGGCNGFSASYQRDSDEIGFGSIMSTKMYCEDRSEIEQRFFEALDEARSWKKTGAVLDLYDGDGDLLARFAASSVQD